VLKLEGQARSQASLNNPRSYNLPKAAQVKRPENKCSAHEWSIFNSAMEDTRVSAFEMTKMRPTS
jgi:hypothetical protein